MRPTDLERAIRRAIAAGELKDGEIAAELGCRRERVTRVRMRLRQEHRDPNAGAVERRRAQ